MTQEHFKEQMGRLSRNFNEKNYGQERLHIFFRAFQSVPDNDFTDTVDEAIANLRAAPMVQDLEKILTEVRQRRKEAAARSGDASANYLSMLQSAADASDPQVKEYAQRCVALVKQKCEGKISMAHFLEGCDLLDMVAKQLEGARKQRLREAKR